MFLLETPYCPGLSHFFTLVRTDLYFLTTKTKGLLKSPEVADISTKSLSSVVKGKAKYSPCFPYVQTPAYLITSSPIDELTAPTNPSSVLSCVWIRKESVKPARIRINL